MGHRIIEFRSG